MTKGKQRSGNPAKRMPEDIKVSGSTTIALGCETCPGRREVTVAIVGGLSLASEPDAMPFAVSTCTRVEARGMRAILLNTDVVKLDQQSCDKPPEEACEYADLITKVADGIEAHPAALEWHYAPPVSEAKYPRIEGI